MILTISFSKPAKDCAEKLGRPYIRIRIQRIPSLGTEATQPYQAEFCTATQAFHKKMSEEELQDFVQTHAGTSFKNVIERTETEEIHIIANRHGTITRLRRPLQSAHTPFSIGNRQKNYLLPAGTAIPFLVQLGVMTESGAVIAQKYDKYRQINRFVEFINDVIPSVQKLASQNGTFSAEKPLRIVDFGCGKSYLTFAVYYLLHELRHIPIDITGLDLKEDVIARCRQLAVDCAYTGLHFAVGNIADYHSPYEPDIIISLHACDTATDHALHYAVTHNAKAILCVPCCQHELNGQLEANKASMDEHNPYASLTKYGIIRERFSALATDALRAEKLEQHGYAVQILEFIDMEHTPKNVLIRAVKKNLASNEAKAANEQNRRRSQERSATLRSVLHVSQSLHELLPD